MLNSYVVTLKSGITVEGTREEPEGKNVIGLWNWSLGRNNPILLDFNECTILSNEVAMIERPRYLQEVQEDAKEKAKDYWENVQDEDDLGTEPSDYGC